MDTVNFKAITDSEFEAEVEKSKGLTLIDFHAPWCGPCRMLKPMLVETAAEFDGRVKVLNMDIDENQETPNARGIRAIPCMILYRDGAEVDRKVGMIAKSQLQEWLNKALEDAKIVEEPKIAVLEDFKPTYPVFENPGVENGILKKDDLYIVFVGNAQQGVFKTPYEAKDGFRVLLRCSNLTSAMFADIPVYELREVTEMKLVKIE